MEDSLIRIYQTGSTNIIGSLFGFSSSQTKIISVPRKSLDYESLKKTYKIRVSWSENDKQVILNFGENTQMSFDVF